VKRKGPPRPAKINERPPGERTLASPPALNNFYHREGYQVKVLRKGGEENEGRKFISQEA